MTDPPWPIRMRPPAMPSSRTDRRRRRGRRRSHRRRATRPPRARRRHPGAYSSLRRPAPPRQERYALGRTLRQRAGRSALGHWDPPADRTDPVELVMATNEGRVTRLVPVRIGRMAASPFAFLRGAASIMAEDFAAAAGHRDPAGDLRRRPPEQLRLLRLARARPGVRPQRLRRGPPRRLGVGPAPARRERVDGRAAERQRRRTLCGAAVARCVRSYRDHLANLAEQPLLDRAYERVDLDRLRGDRDGRRRPARDRAGGAAGPPQDQRPRAAPVHPRSDDRDGAAASSRSPR